MKQNIIRVIGILCILTMFTTSANAGIVKELPQQIELENFTASVESENYWTNIATLDAIDQHPTWPHDVWMDKEGEFYISFYYADSNSTNGYTSVYYDDYGSKLGAVCGIKFKLVEAYPGLNTIDVVVNNTTTHCSPKPSVTAPVEVHNNSFVNTGNQTDNNITVITASGNLSSGANSTGTVNNQGVIDRIEQYLFDFSNTNWSNVTLQIFGH